MEISSGGGSSEHGDHPAMHFKQPPQPEMGFRPRGFRPPFLGPHDQPWRCNGPGPQMMWNEFNPRQDEIVYLFDFSSIFFLILDFI